ncbi:Gx transporter family protein [Pseudoflavonifractor phocaeensis]|uniref:Gx transporter family protein n=1 Tax=Pseudoflavonifractor phocaeensis TaxID=1870988 RepID=UPI00210C38B1|nr:Gx transporter family protein [Pseudoflavonifractor phocaeensis]MCQ4865887.1 Gx transporter family protein [Pseudoflavonifractor phocaeensis]
MSRNSSRLATQKMTRLALLAAVAVVLGYFEGIIIAFMFLPPGIKLGLANTVLLYSVYLLGPGYSVILMILKVVLTGYMSGNLAAAFLYSMGGGALSLGMMLLVKKLGGNDKVSIVGVSVVGAVFHNVGQLLVASLVVRTPGLMLYIFPLLISAVVTGVITGLAGRQIVRVLRLPGAPDPLSSKTKDPGEDT